VRALKHVQRAYIILHFVERRSVLEVARRVSDSRPAVWRCQVRYAEHGVDALLCDKIRPPGRTPLSTAKLAEVLALTCSQTPGVVTNWAGRAMFRSLELRAVEAQHLLDRSPH
jgi:hypothetical protein